MNWALIGASTIAAEHMIGALRGNGGQVSWLVSGDVARGQAYAAAHGIGRAGTSVAEMLGDAGVEAVYISSTNEKHHAQAMACIAAGRHVICEKPLAMSVADAEGMVRAAEAAGVRFATNHHLRCAGSHRAIRDLIVRGRVGRVLSLRIHHAVHLPVALQGWRINDAGAGGGVIPDITVHDADCVRVLLGEGPVSVVAQAGVSGMGAGVEDSVMWVGVMASGAMVMAHESFTHA
ncbi:MAG: Gfo/Idh/MocA family protein, partial [Paracoccaceae bacterium]